MDGYSSRDVAAMLKLSVRQVRSYAGFLAPGRGTRGEYRFGFQDLVLLRTAKDLVDAHVPATRVRRALAKLRGQLPDGRPLSALRVASEGREVLARDGAVLWNAESGQVLFDFDADGASSSSRAPRSPRLAAVPPLAEDAQEAAAPAPSDAEEWHALGSELEASDRQKAIEAYRRVLALQPRHADAHVNLGRLLHEGADFGAAETHYRAALEADPAHAVASFNLGVVLEDRGRLAEAVEAYLALVRRDPAAADAHYRLASVYERLGKNTLAIRHLSAYRRLVRG